MDFNFRKMWPAVAASLVAATSLVYAEKTDRKHDEKEIGIINPSVHPIGTDENWFLLAEGFYWKSHQDGLEYAVEDNAYIGSVINDGRFVNPDFRWDFGFRVGAGYAFDHDGWDLALKWTRFNNRAHETVSNCCATEDTTSVIIMLMSDIPTLDGDAPGPGTPDLQAGQIKNHWKLRLNLVDLELGREFMTSKWLYLRPHMGLRGAWIKQKMENDVVDVINAGAGFTTTAFDEQEFKNNFKGIGLRGGLDSQWNMGNGFSFYGNLAASIIYGRFNLSMEEKARSSSVATSITVLDIEESFHSSKGILDLGLGLRYGHQFTDTLYNLMISFGWENHIFFNQNQLWQITKDEFRDSFCKRSGDLGTQGWTLGFRFDF